MMNVAKNEGWQMKTISRPSESFAFFTLPMLRVTPDRQTYPLKMVQDYFMLRVLLTPVYFWAKTAGRQEFVTYMIHLWVNRQFMCHCLKKSLNLVAVSKLTNQMIRVVCYHKAEKSPPCTVLLDSGFFTPRVLSTWEMCRKSSKQGTVWRELCEVYQNRSTTC